MKLSRRDQAKDDCILEFLPPAPCRVFEASAGKGALAWRLAQAGYEVQVSNWRLGTVTFALPEIAADLNEPLPVPDQSVDAVVCREVIEHVQSVPHVLAEFHRMLAPGGVLVLTFPNRLFLRSRLYHLCTGFYAGMESPINLDVRQGEAHINLIGYPEMDYFLRKAGFTVPAVATSHVKLLDRLLLAARPALYLAGWYYLLCHKRQQKEHSKTRPADRAYNRLILKRLTSPALLAGKDVILRAQKA